MILNGFQIMIIIAYAYIICVGGDIVDLIDDIENMIKRAKNPENEK